MSMTPAPHSGPGRPSRALALAEVSASLEALGLDPVRALSDIAELLRLYGTPSTLSSIHRELMLQWFGSSDLQGSFSGSGPLRREEIVAVAVRMSALDTATAYSVDEISALLGESEQEVRRLVDDRNIWTFGHKAILVPAWQFEIAEDKASPISPHLATVVSAIPRNAPPALVRGLMTLEDPQLSRNNNTSTSPRDWLLKGHGPMPVVALLLRHLEGSDDRLLSYLWGAA
ncbi:hypothetical protein [Curtobacterium sp. MCLR17_044]|uniref:hypothetical protein n=1 Tax=Curtobacterium sp. MCLR17_044 TaxID=2175628 RepID=UPI0011B4D2A7|nr:hypothetical protein [Curtobacterium sp. MCLR17_044]